MQRDSEELISNNQRTCIVEAIKQELRLDGRTPYECRPLRVQYALDDRSATVQLGATTAMAAITAALEAPFSSRSREGSVRFNVELSPMASAAFGAGGGGGGGRPGGGGGGGDAAVELARLVERCLRGSGALDLESLCVLPGRRVWALRVDVRVLDAAGNLVDACCLAALAALLGFRKPQVEVDQSASEPRVVVYAPDVREPQPLSLHHLPLPHTFAVFEGGAVLAADPNRAEERAAQGSATVFVNPHGEVCGWQMADGVGLDQGQMMRCVRLAAARAPDLAAALQGALREHEVARVQARVRRHTGAAAAVAAGGVGGDPRNVTVLSDPDAADERLRELLAEIREAVARQQLQDERREEAAAAAAAAKQQAAAAAAAAGVAATQQGQQQEPQFVKPPPRSAGAGGGARLVGIAGSSGSSKRAADAEADARLAAFLGIDKGGSGAGGGPRAPTNIDDIEAAMFAPGTTDLAAAVKRKKGGGSSSGGGKKHSKNKQR